MKQLILFDGVCHFCNSSVQFIIKRDPEAKFHFASLQSKHAKQLLAKQPLPHDLDSLILVTEERVYIKSDAVLQIVRQLPGAWKLSYIFQLIPRGLRHYCYDIFAKNRNRLLGRKKDCPIPSSEIRERFL